jgi:hypothetical protein
MLRYTQLHFGTLQLNCILAGLILVPTPNTKDTEERYLRRYAASLAVPFPIMTLDISILPNPSSRTVTLESNLPLTQTNTRNLPGAENRPARKVDNPTANCEPII